MAKKTARKKAARRKKIDTASPLSRKVTRAQAIWLDGPVPAGFWAYEENQKLYLLWLGQKQGFRKLDDYYRLMRLRQRNRGAASCCTAGADQPCER